MRLSISPNVVPEWGIWEALREIIQGAIDYSKDDYIVNYDSLTQKLIIKNSGMLSRASLLIGHSDKREDDTKIGQHGEGYKLAAAILLRNNKRFRIYNNEEIWTFSYKWDRRFKTNVINVDIKKWFVDKTHTIMWEINDITQKEFDEFENKTIKKGDIRGKNSWILLNQPGKIFSGGLFVCNKKDLSFGYNFDVGVLKLQRDRDLISDFDIFYQTSIAWKNLPDAAGHIKNEIEDVKYINIQQYEYNEPKKDEIRNNTVATMFYSEYGNNANPCTYESDKIKGANNVIVSETYRDSVRKSINFKKIEPIKSEKTPYDILKEWYDEYYSEYDEDESFEEILEQSKTWKITKPKIINNDILF